LFESLHQRSRSDVRLESRVFGCLEIRLRRVVTQIHHDNLLLSDRDGVVDQRFDLTPIRSARLEHVGVLLEYRTPARRGAEEQRLALGDDRERSLAAVTRRVAEQCEGLLLLDELLRIGSGFVVLAAVVQGDQTR
jgi:hypothetical protein